MRTVYYNCNGFEFTDYTWIKDSLHIACTNEHTTHVIEEPTPDTPELARHRQLVAEKFGIED